MLKLSDEKFIISFEHKAGDLPYMVTYQSIDGRLHTKYYGEANQAIMRKTELVHLGCRAKLYIDAENMIFTKVEQ